MKPDDKASKSFSDICPLISSNDETIIILETEQNIEHASNSP